MLIVFVQPDKAHLQSPCIKPEAVLTLNKGHFQNPNVLNKQIGSHCVHCKANCPHHLDPNAQT